MQHLRCDSGLHLNGTFTVAVMLTAAVARPCGDGAHMCVRVCALHIIYGHI